MIHLDFWEEDCFLIYASSQVRDELRRTYNRASSRYVVRWNKEEKVWVCHFQYFPRHLKLMRSPFISLLNNNSRDPGLVVTRELKDRIRSWNKRIDSSEGIRDVVTDEPDLSLDLNALNHPLRPYQETGAIWMDHAGYGILGDPVGTGKTATALRLCQKRLDSDSNLRILIVAPKTLTIQWVEEGIQKFLPPHLREYVLIRGGRKERWEGWCTDRIFTVAHYEAVRVDYEWIKDRHWSIIIADEVQKIRNQKSWISRRMRALSADERYGLTATAIENTIDELYSIYKFIHPGILGNFGPFKKHFTLRGSRDEYKGAQKAHVKDELMEKIQFTFLRRPKDLISSQLPELVEQTVHLEMTDEQKRYYNQVMLEDSSILDLLEAQGKSLEYTHGESGISRNLYVISKILYLREVCNSPATIDPTWTGKTAKTDFLIDLLESFEGKAIFFTFFERMSRIIEELLVHHRKKLKLGRVWRVHGKTRDREREMVKREFNTSSERDIIISTDTLKYGYNLQAANAIVNIDSGYNPAVKEQRIGRAYRLGSESVVKLGDGSQLFVWNLLIQSSVEERIEKIIKRKQELFSMVMTEMETDLGLLKSFSKEEIESVISEQQGEDIRWQDELKQQLQPLNS
jgi:SNF2 family DNA or RNA helicase